MDWETTDGIQRYLNQNVLSDIFAFPFFFVSLACELFNLIQTKTVPLVSIPCHVKTYGYGERERERESHVKSPRAPSLQ